MAISPDRICSQTAETEAKPDTEIIQDYRKRVAASIQTLFETYQTLDLAPRKKGERRTVKEADSFIELWEPLANDKRFSLYVDGFSMPGVGPKERYKLRLYADVEQRVEKLGFARRKKITTIDPEGHFVFSIEDEKEFTEIVSPNNFMITIITLRLIPIEEECFRRKTTLHFGSNSKDAWITSKTSPEVTVHYADKSNQNPLPARGVDLRIGSTDDIQCPRRVDGKNIKHLMSEQAAFMATKLINWTRLLATQFPQDFDSLSLVETTVAEAESALNAINSHIKAAFTKSQI